MHSDICRQVNAGRWMQKTVNWKRTWVDIHTSASAYILWGMQSGFSVGGKSCVGPVSCWPSFSVGVRRRLVFCCRFKCLKSVVLTLFTHAHPPFVTPLCLYFPSPTHRHTLACGRCSCYSSASSFALLWTCVWTTFDNSVLGHRIPEVPVPLFSVYPATKHAITALCQTVRQEIHFLKLNIKLTVS